VVGHLVNEQKKRRALSRCGKGQTGHGVPCPYKTLGSIGGWRLTGHDESCPYTVRILDWATGGMKPECTLGLVD